jgi:hypothetical protein
MPLASFLGELGREATSCFTAIGDTPEGCASLYCLSSVLEGLLGASEVAGL